MALEQSLRRNFFSSWLQTQKMETVGTSARTDCSLEHGELLLVFADVMIMGRGLHHVAGVSWHHTCAESSQGGGSARSAILSVLKRPATRQVISGHLRAFGVIGRWFSWWILIALVPRVLDARKQARVQLCAMLCHYWHRYVGISRGSQAPSFWDGRY